MSLDKSRFAQIVNEDARLNILEALNMQPSGQLNETLLDEALQRCGHNRSREWVRHQLKWLAEMGAVTLDEPGNVLVATLTRAGLDHIERKAFLDGVKIPRPEF